jgi:hypothetical protein
MRLISAVSGVRFPASPPKTKYNPLFLQRVFCRFCLYFDQFHLLHNLVTQTDRKDQTNGVENEKQNRQIPILPCQKSLHILLAHKKGQHLRATLLIFKFRFLSNRHGRLNTLLHTQVHSQTEIQIQKNQL